MLIVEPADPSAGVELGPYGPLGTPVWPETPEPGGGEWGWNGARTTIYLAMTTPRSTGNDDTPAAQFIDGVLPASANFGSALFDGVDPMSRSRPTVGEIMLIDPDGSLDYPSLRRTSHLANTGVRTCRGSIPRMVCSSRFQGAAFG